MAKTQAIQFNSKLEVSTNKLWGAHFVVPAAIAEKLTTEDSRRVVCRLNDSVEYQCGILRGVKGKYVITVNKKIRTQLGLSTGDTISVRLKADESEYGLPMPEEFTAALETDEEGSRYFHALTPGKQRTLIYIAANVKNSEARIIRALNILEHLKKYKGVINYKELNLKNSNI